MVELARARRGRPRLEVFDVGRPWFRAAEHDPHIRPLFGELGGFQLDLELRRRPPGGALVEKAAEGTYEYDVFISLSGDGGESWGKPERPHRDGTLSEHGFVSLVADDASGFSAVWLDGRAFEKGASDNEMNLRTTRFDSGGYIEDLLLDGRVCECCQTGMARTEAGLFVAYRNRSDDETEIRDISYVRQIDGKWTEPETLYEDGWELSGCPVNGPQVAAWLGSAPPRASPKFSFSSRKMAARASVSPSGLSGSTTAGRWDVWTSNGSARTSSSRGSNGAKSATGRSS